MAYQIISGWKIDKVAKILVEPYLVKIKDVENKMGEVLEAEFAKFLPDTVLKFWKEYPDRVILEGSVRFKFNKDSFYAVVNLPTLSSEIKNKILEDGSDLKNTLDFLADKVVSLRAERTKMQNQIKCTLSKLKSYTKICNEFPEAHSVLILEVDGEAELPNSNMCDDVEALRAKLNRNKA